MTNQILFENANVGPYCPPGSSPIERRGERGFATREVVADFETIEKNPEGFTMNIPDASIDDIPRQY
jgi:hypothetical protein